MLKEKYQVIKDAMIEKYGKEKGEAVFVAWCKKENVDVEAKSFNFITSMLELKSENDVDVVEGWFSVGEPDSYNDIVTEECMEGMVGQLKSLPITIDDNHESFKDKGYGERFKSLNPIAKVVDAELKGNRVWVKTVLNKAHSKYEEYKSSIKNGFLHSFSFAFIPVKTEYKSIGGIKHRLLNAVNLLNGCFTGVPVHREATFSNVALKALAEGFDEEEVKSLLEGLNMTDKKEEIKSEKVEVSEEVKSLTDKVSALEKELAELKAVKEEVKAEEEVKEEEKEEVEEVKEEAKDEVKEAESVAESEEVKALKDRIEVLEKTIAEPQYKAVVDKKEVSKEEVKSKGIKGPIDLIA